MTTTTTYPVYITVRCRAWSGLPAAAVRCRVDEDGTVRVHDDISGYYTRLHSISPRTQGRIRRLAAAACGAKELV